MTDQWKQFVGDLHVADDGTFLVRDPTSGFAVKGAQNDRSRAEAQGSVDGRWTWAVDVPAHASVEEIELNDQEWNALFLNRPGYSERPSVHNSWCRQCPSVGISHGVCC